jgi:hypothetical protein
MAQTGFLRYLKLAWFSGPPCERTIYRRMNRQHPKRIVEIGLGLGVRSLRLFQVAGRYCPPGEIRYTGIDLFEGRDPGAPHLPMKTAYKLLRSHGVQVRLVPGDPANALRSAGQSLANTDLIVIDSDIADSDLEPAWRWMHTIMHGETLVARQCIQDGRKTCQMFNADDVKRLATGGKDSVPRAA